MPLKLKGPKMECPMCGKVDQLSRNESVLCNTPIKILPNGNWEWDQDRETKVHWDTSDYQSDQGDGEWRCRHCDVNFDAPEVKSNYEVEYEKLVQP